MLTLNFFIYLGEDQLQTLSRLPPVPIYGIRDVPYVHSLLFSELPSFLLLLAFPSLFTSISHLEKHPPSDVSFIHNLFILIIKLPKITCTLVSVSLLHFHSFIHCNMLHGSHSAETVFAKDTKDLVANPSGSFSVLNFIVLFYAFMYQALDTWSGLDFGKPLSPYLSR